MVERLRRVNVRRLAFIVFAVLLAAWATTGAMRAADVVTQPSVLLPENGVVDGDLYVAAGSVRLNGRVRGDLTVAGGVVNVVGPVDGAVSVAAARAEIRGRVARSVKVAGGIVAVYGRVEGDVVVAGGTLRLVEGSSVGGDVVGLGGAITVVAGSVVDGDLVAAASAVTVEGRIGGDVLLRSPRIEVAPTAAIGGRFALRGDPDPAISPRAQLAQPMTELPPLALPPVLAALLWRDGAAPRLAALLGFGAVAVALWPRRGVAVADSLRRDRLGAAAAGIAGVVFGPIVAVLLAITVVGLPFALVGALALLGAMYASQAVVGLALGRLLLGVGHGERRRGRNLAALMVGVTILSAVRLAPWEPVAWLATAVITFLGVGALVMTAVAEARSPGPDVLPPSNGASVFAPVGSVAR